MRGLLAVLQATGSIRMVAVQNAVGPFTYIDALKIDSLSRIVVVVV